jgi:HK97 family phage prohead protease
MAKAQATEKPKMEYRDTFEVRATTDVDGGGAEVSGYVCVFNCVDSHISAFAPGAFTKTLSERDGKIPLLYQHNPALNIGLPSEHKVDQRGLFVTARIFDDGAEGSTLSARLRQGALYGFSFGFLTVSDRMANETDQIDLSQMPFDGLDIHDVRYITEVKLFEDSIVTFPSNETAEIESIREARQADGITQLLEAIRDGSLTERQRSTLDALVEAYQAAPDGETPNHAEPNLSERRIAAELAIAQYGHGII